MDRYWAEQIVAFLILEKYLKEDFHFTAYNTISYIRKGPIVPKKENDILFHGARVLKLPECDDVWGSEKQSDETVAQSNSTPKSNTQSTEKRRKNSSQEGSAKRTKTKPSGSSSSGTSQQGTSSRTFTSATTPKTPSLANRSAVKNSPKNFSTTKESSKLTNAPTKDSVVIDASKRLLEREDTVKSNKIEAPRVVVAAATDDVIYIPEDHNVIEILDED